MLKCDAFKYTFGKSAFYLCLIKAKGLLGNYIIDAYDATDNRDGYQRKIQKSRAVKFADYLMKCNGSFNGTVLLNVRNPKALTYVKARNSDFGKLTINDKMCVVDGQHRIEGLSLAVKEGYSGNVSVPAIVTVGKDRNHEALSFLIINRTAKGIKTDLTDELIYRTIPNHLLTDDLKKVLSLSVQQTIGEFALSVTKILNESKDGVWFQRITMPEDRTSGNRTIRQSSFAYSVREAIKSCGKLRRAVNIGDIESVGKWLKDYWKAIAEICPIATSLKDAEGYVLMKTVGVTVMNRLFSRILDDAGEDPEISNFVDSLKKMEYLEDAAWRSKKGTFAKQGTNKAALDNIYNTLELQFDTSTQQ